MDSPVLFAIDGAVLGALIGAGASLLVAGLALWQQRGHHRDLLRQQGEILELDEKQRRLDREQQLLLQKADQRFKSHQRFLTEISEVHNRYLRVLDAYAKGHEELGRIQWRMRMLRKGRDEGKVAPTDYEQRWKELSDEGKPWEMQAEKAKEEMYALRSRIQALAGDELAKGYEASSQAALALELNFEPDLEGQNRSRFDEAKQALIDAYRESVAAPESDESPT
jgi:hypothetical protein